MKLADYDGARRRSFSAERGKPAFRRHADAKHDHVWENGASLCAECLSSTFQ